MAKGLEAMAKGLGALAGGGDGKTIDPGELPGAPDRLPRFLRLGESEADRREDDRAGELLEGRRSSTARATHASKRRSSTRASINCSCCPYTWITNTGYEKETESGYEKAVKVAGNPGFEKWNSEGKDGEVNAFINKRFILQIEGRNIDDPKVLHQLAAAADLGKLANLK